MTEGMITDNCPELSIVDTVATDNGNVFDVFVVSFVSFGSVKGINAITEGIITDNCPELSIVDTVATDGNGIQGAGIRSGTGIIDTTDSGNRVKGNTRFDDIYIVSLKLKKYKIIHINIEQ